MAQCGGQKDSDIQKIAQCFSTLLHDQYPDPIERMLQAYQEGPSFVYDNEKDSKKLAMKLSIRKNMFHRGQELYKDPATKQRAYDMFKVMAKEKDGTAFVWLMLNVKKNKDVRKEGEDMLYWLEEYRKLFPIGLIDANFVRVICENAREEYKNDEKTWASFKDSLKKYGYGKIAYAQELLYRSERMRSFIELKGYEFTYFLQNNKIAGAVSAHLRQLENVLSSSKKIKKKASKIEKTHVKALNFLDGLKENEPFIQYLFMEHLILGKLIIPNLEKANDYLQKIMNSTLYTINTLFRDFVCGRAKLIMLRPEVRSNIRLYENFKKIIRENKKDVKYGT